MPELAIEPPGAPSSIDQVTVLSLDPVTVAENDCAPPDGIDAIVGAITTTTGPVTGGPEVGDIPHAETAHATTYTPTRLRADGCMLLPEAAVSTTVRTSYRGD